MTTQYQPNIPTGLVNLDVDYQNLQNNFSQLDTSFGINHIKYSVAANNGKHTFVEMPLRASIPTPLTGSEGTVYTKTANVATQLFYTPDNSTNEYQLTRTISADFGTFGASTGWTFLPGGMILQWGQTAVAAQPATTNINFSTAFTNPCYSVVITPIRNSTNVDIVYVVSQGTSSFVAKNTSGGGITTINWIAIGN